MRSLRLEMAQNVVQRVLDTLEVAGALLGGRLQTFEQMRHALLEMGECGCVVVADRHAIEAVG